MDLPHEDDSDSQNEADVISLSSASLESGQKTSAKDAEKDMRDKIISKEETQVIKARIIVIIGGIACTAAVAAAINIFAKQNDQAIFESEVRKSGRRQNQPYLLLVSRKTEETLLTQFDTVLSTQYNGFVTSIVSLVLLEIQFNFALMQQMSASVTASAVMTGSVFPNHTEPFFEISGGYVDGM